MLQSQKLFFIQIDPSIGIIKRKVQKAIEILTKQESDGSY